MKRHMGTIYRNITQAISGLRMLVDGVVLQEMWKHVFNI